MKLTVPKMLASASATVFLVTSVTAVHLRQYSQNLCTGNRRTCPNIPRHTCCRDTRGGFVSGSCANCEDHWLHVVWSYVYGDASPECGYPQLSKLGTHPNCIDHSPGPGFGPVTGHSWSSLPSETISTQRRSGIVTEEELNAQQCEGAVEPTVYEIGDRAFEINDTVSDELKQVLFDTWVTDSGDLAKRGGIPGELDALEITGLLPDDWE